MSQEFACPNCRIALQVSPRQLGRQVRCPVCGLISVFGSPLEDADVQWQPVQSATDDQPALAGRQGAASNRNQWRPIEPTDGSKSRGPNSAATTARAEEYVATYVNASFDDAPDRAWWIGLACGLVSLLGGNMVCFCCLLGPFGSTFFAVAGLVATAFSKRGPKAVNIVIGGLGLVISLVMLLLMAIAKLD